MRSPGLIRAEIDALAERRSALWQQLGEGDGELRVELTVVTARIDALWLELRVTAAHVRAGPRGAILERARRDRRAEQELRRWVPLA